MTTRKATETQRPVLNGCCVYIYIYSSLNKGLIITTSALARQPLTPPPTDEYPSRARFLMELVFGIVLWPAWTRGRLNFKRPVRINHAPPDPSERLRSEFKLDFREPFVRPPPPPPRSPTPPLPQSIRIINNNNV